MLTYLFFADDSLLFWKTNMAEAYSVHQVLQEYEKASVQLTNS